MMATTSRALELIEAVGTVGSPPLVYERLVEVINHPRSGAADIAAVIAEDPGLTARLLKVVNSAFFSLPWRVETVSAAVRVVGTLQIRDLAVATAVVRLFRDVPEDLLDMAAFWHHSLACGVASRVLATYRHEDNVERFFVAGLLHDVGRVVLLMGAGPEMSAALAHARHSDAALLDSERTFAGADHASVGGALLDRWNFPPAFREAVRHHHRPAAAARFPVETAAVHVANVVANALAWGRSGERRVPAFDPRAWDALSLDLWQLPLIVEDAHRQIEAAIHLVAGEEAS